MDFKKASDTATSETAANGESSGNRWEPAQVDGVFLGKQNPASGDQQCAVIPGTHFWCHTSGQCIMSHILFVIYISDMPKTVSSNAKMFADDTKLFARSDTEDDTTVIQEDLHSLYDRSENWQL